MPVKKPVVVKGEKFTLQVRIVSYYDVEVTANDFQSAIEKGNGINAYDMLTTKIPMDCDKATVVVVVANDRLEN